MKVYVYFNGYLKGIFRGFLDATIKLQFWLDPVSNNQIFEPITFVIKQRPIRDIMSTKLDVMRLYLTYFQTTYLMRPHCNVKEGFFDKWCDNINQIGLLRDDETTILAHALLIFKKPLKQRLHFGNKMLDLIHEIARKISVA